MRPRHRHHRANLLLMATLFAAGSLQTAHAGEQPQSPGAVLQSRVISQEDIARALAPKPRTRGISLRTRSDAREVIDLTIPFELDSSELRKDAVAQLEQLEGALKAESLLRFRFRVTGHTDARGDAAYNRALSLRRAESVQRYLVAHGIDQSRLEIAGEGEEQLLRPEAPEDAANRRVEIRNLGGSP